MLSLWQGLIAEHPNHIITHPPSGKLLPLLDPFANLVADQHSGVLRSGHTEGETAVIEVLTGAVENSHSSATIPFRGGVEEMPDRTLGNPSTTTLGAITLLAFLNLLGYIQNVLTGTSGRKRRSVTFPPTNLAKLSKVIPSNSILSKPQTGCPRKINDRAAQKLVRTVVRRPQTTIEELNDDLKASGIKASKHTISRALRRECFRSRKPRRTPLLQKRHVMARLKYANDHLNNAAAFWNSVLWSYETKIELFGRNSTNHAWRQQNEEYKPDCTIPTVKFGGGSIIVWGCFSSSWVDKVHIIEGTMNGRKYCEILEEQLLPSARLLKLKRGWKFQQDNDPKHTVNETKERLRMEEINILEWPSQSPDMNQIENLWRELKLKIQKRDPNNITELKEICTEEWNKIAPETCKRLVVNYYKRLEAIINNKGYGTKY
ncbi:Transposase Tc1-like [Trinorchestia longiramus]|nr:Transposase Tc1-like [Trinorchestia longiramus]